MSHQAYLGNVLEPTVKPWLQNVQKGSVDPFVLEEDGDSGHRGSSKQNIIRKWKDTNGFISYFNCLEAPIWLQSKTVGKFENKCFEKHRIGTILRRKS